MKDLDGGARKPQGILPPETLTKAHTYRSSSKAHGYLRVLKQTQGGVCLPTGTWSACGSAQLWPEGAGLRAELVPGGGEEQPRKYRSADVRRVTGPAPES